MDKLGWKVRIGFGAGDFAQNLVYPAAAMYLLFFYTDVLGIAPSSAAAIFLVAQIVDFVWNPFAGAFIDSRSPRLGKYRTWLLAAGLPLAALAVMCFWNPFGAQGGRDNRLDGCEDIPCERRVSCRGRGSADFGGDVWRRAR